MMRKKEKREIKYKGKRTGRGGLPFEAILKDGTLQLDENTFAAIYRFENAPYLSQTETEQESIYAKYVSLLNGLPSGLHYQEILYNVPVDRERIDALMIPPEAESEYLKSYREVQKRFADRIAVDVTQKEYLLCLSYTKAGPLDNPFSALQRAAAALEGKLQAIGSGLTPLLRLSKKAQNTKK